MLDSKPPGNLKTIKTWQSVERNTFKMILSHWAMIEHEVPIFHDDLGLDSWQKGNSKYLGTRPADTQAKHGIVRSVTADDTIQEASYKFDKLHGLMVEY